MLLVFGKLTTAGAHGKDNEAVKWVPIVVAEEGLEAKFFGEGYPDLPGTAPVGLGLRYNRLVEGFCPSIEINSECISLPRGRIFQAFVCVYLELKWARSCESDKCQRREALSAMLLLSPLMWETSW